MSSMRCGGPSMAGRSMSTRDDVTVPRKPWSMRVVRGAQRVVPHRGSVPGMPRHEWIAEAVSVESSGRNAKIAL